MLYIQRRSNRDLETVDEFETRKEAKAMLAEYRLADRSAEYYISARPCKAWREKDPPAEPETRVIFRAFKDTGHVIAYFIDVHERENCISSYMHVGQHAAARYSLALTRPATNAEYAPLKRELESAPYNYRLRVVTRNARKR